MKTFIALQVNSHVFVNVYIKTVLYAVAQKYITIISALKFNWIHLNHFTTDRKPTNICLFAAVGMLTVGILGSNNCVSHRHLSAQAPAVM